MDGISAGRAFGSAAVHHFLMVQEEPYSTIPSLEKICGAFGITLSQLFVEDDSPVSLTDSQKRLLEAWSRLSEEQQAAIFALIEKI